MGLLTLNVCQQLPFFKPTYLMSFIYSAVACNLDRHILTATLPLLAEEKVEAIEWAFDALYQQEKIPDWFEDLMLTFGQSGRLMGHGVFFSLFAGRWSKEQAQWLKHLQQLSQRYNFDQVTEHFGFMTGTDFHAGAPLGIPFTPTTLAIGQDRLQRIQAAAQCPVGLENLAFAYSLEDVKRHGEFLDQLIRPVNGFIILDLHNLYCQLHNFDCEFEDVIHLYPLERVREIHISGGSWEASDSQPSRNIRRDTHDESVPEKVFQLLAASLPLCPNLKYVVLEQLGNGLHTAESQQQFRQDFYRMDRLLKTYQSPYPNTSHEFLPVLSSPPIEPIESEALYQQQQVLSYILEHVTTVEEAQKFLAASPLANTEWNTANWQPHMLETALKIAQKWKKGFPST